MTITSGMINTISTGTATDKPKLLIAHGLFGSAKNFGAIAKRLGDERQVITADMRNHGHSGWFDSHSYNDLADDLAEVIIAHDGPVDLLGHSMGGKAVMALALTHPDLVRRLIVADIAPISYEHSQMEVLTAMRGLDLSGVEKRADADAALAELIKDAATRAFLLQSLDIKAKRWRINLEVLAGEMPKIMGFPEFSTTFARACLFLSGGASDYVLSDHRPRIKTLFPKARFARIPDAGHWLHAEKPREFSDTVRAFLNA